MRYSFVILTYNSTKTIEAAIDSIFLHAPRGLFEVIVVDNASKDGSAEFVRNKYGDKVVVVANAKNKGFSGGINDGIAVSRGEFIVLLNPDATFSRVDFDQLKSHFEDSDVGIVAPRIEWPNGDIQPSFGFFPHRISLLLYFFKIARFLPKGFLVYNNIWNKKYYRDVSKVDWVSGCSLMIRRSFLDDLGRFDDAYFLYVEDVDLSRRVANAGKDVVIDPQWVVSHVLQASVKEDLAKNMEFQSDGFVRYFNIHENKNVQRLMNMIYFLKKKKLPEQDTHEV